MAMSDVRAAQILVRALAELADVDDPATADEYLKLVRVTADLRQAANALQRQSVTAARSAGVTWSAVGGALGMTKQAAQKRFTVAAPPDGAGLGDDERIIGPLTTVNELHELNLAGRYGWHSIEFGPYYHRVVRSDSQWEHTRVSVLGRRARDLQSDGWELIGTGFPYSYLKRNLGTPARAE